MFQSFDRLILDPCPPDHSFAAHSPSLSQAGIRLSHSHLSFSLLPSSLFPSLLVSLHSPHLFSSFFFLFLLSLCLLSTLHLSPLPSFSFSSTHPLLFSSFSSISYLIISLLIHLFPDCCRQGILPESSKTLYFTKHKRNIFVCIHMYTYTYLYILKVFTKAIIYQCKSQRHT